MKIKQLNYNYHECGIANDQWGEDYEIAIIGQRGITEITEHQAMGEGDKWFYDIHYENGEIHRVFNPNSVVFADPSTEEKEE